MAAAPHPITSPPPVPGQPYSATNPGGPEDQTAPETIYDAQGGSGAAEPWPKIQDGGGCDWTTGKARAGDWPGDGTSDGSAWKQT